MIKLKVVWLIYPSFINLKVWNWLSLSYKQILNLSLSIPLFLIDAILIGPMLCSGWIGECLWVACLGLKWHWRGWRLPQAPLGCLTVGEYNRSARTLISSAFHKPIRRIVVKYTQIKKRGTQSCGRMNIDMDEKERPWFSGAHVCIVPDHHGHSH